MQQHINESWTGEEIKVWAAAGLIPIELLDQNKGYELIDYITKNQQQLFEHYRCESHKTFEIESIDKETGKITILPQTRLLKLSNNIVVSNIKAKEWDDWKESAAKSLKFNKEQGKFFKEAVDRMIQKGTSSKDDIISLIDEISKGNKKVNKVRHGGHYTDLTLNRNLLQANTALAVEKIEKFKITKAYGLRLEVAEEKLVNVLLKLLHDKSETKNTLSEEFYTGNNEENIKLTYGNIQLNSASIRIKPRELYKEYSGKDKVSGKEEENIKNILRRVSEKRFLIQYDRTRKSKIGKKESIVTDRIEAVETLFSIKTYTEAMTSEELKKANNGDKLFREQREELIIQFHPILTDQIDSKYIEYPEDINRQTMIASGGIRKVTDSIIAFRDYMMREISAKRFKSELNESTLIDQLRLTEYATKGRKKLVTQRINDAIEASKKLGLILEYKIEIGAQGQIKYIFTLNHNFE